MWKSSLTITALPGTPVVNSLADLFPLMRFLRWKPWSDWKHYKLVLTILP